MYAAAVTTVNLGTFLFNLMVARTFDPALFGATAAILSLLVLFHVPANAFEVVIARALAREARALGDVRPNGSVGPLVGLTAVVGVGIAVIFAALSPVLRHWLHLPTLTSAALVGTYAIPVAAGAVPKGVLFAERRFGWLAGALLAGTTVQLVAGTILVHAGHGVQGALAAMVGGEVVASALLIFSLPHRLTGGSGSGIAIHWPEVRTPAVAFTGFWLMSVVDVLLVQHLEPGVRAGAYGAATVAAQIALFLPGALSAAAFTRFVSAGAANVRARAVLLRAAAAVIALGTVTAVVVGVGAAPVVRVLFSDGYPAAAGVVGLLAVSGGAVSLASLLLQYHSAAGRRMASIPCYLAVASITVGVSLDHPSLRTVAGWTAASTGGAALLLLAMALASARPSTVEVIEQASLALLDADLDLTVVVPYYNPGELLAGNIARLIQVLDRSDATFEVIAVCDGSTDGSERYIGGIDDPRLVHVVLASNQGKGSALRIGLGKGRGRWLGFIDADGDLDPHLFEPFLVLTHLYSPEIILGSKKHPLSEVEYPAVRRLYSGGYRRLTHALFSLDVSDTQTGIKLIRRDVLAAVLPRMVEKRFAFDLELFVIARRLGYRRFLEAPVRLRHQFTSTVSFRDVVRTLRDTVAIAYRMRVLRTYDTPRPAASRADALHVSAISLRGATGSRRSATTG